MAPPLQSIRFSGTLLHFKPQQENFTNMIFERRDTPRRSTPSLLCSQNHLHNADSNFQLLLYLGVLQFSLLSSNEAQTWKTRQCSQDDDLNPPCVSQQTAVLQLQLQLRVAIASSDSLSSLSSSSDKNIQLSHVTVQNERTMRSAI